MYLCILSTYVFVQLLYYRGNVKLIIVGYSYINSIILRVYLTYNIMHFLAPQ